MSNEAKVAEVTSSTSSSAPSAKDAKAAAKAAKAAKRAAAKGLQPGERQAHIKPDNGQSTPQHGQTVAGLSQLQHAHQAQQRSADSSVTAASTSSSTATANGPGAASASLGATAASLASSSPKLLQPSQISVQSSASASLNHDLFSAEHPPPSHFSHRSQLLTTALARGLHPSVIFLQQHLASHTLLGSSARAIATLTALRDFISDYKTPRGAVLNRDLVAKLGHQISGITSARPLGSSAGNAVRYLKYEISVIPAEMREEDAKSHLVSRIDHFIRDRIIFAGRVISGHISEKIKAQGDVIVTFARSSVVEQCLIDAWKRNGKRFEVICVGSEAFNEGKRSAEALLSHGIPTSYAPLTSLASVLPRVSLVLLGTASLLSNGALYSRAGTATVAMMAHTRKVPVIVCCETFKFSERVRLEGVGGNERADSSLLLGQDGLDGTGSNVDAGRVASLPPNLSALNLLYDLTPARYITAVASEVGLSGSESVAILLRDYKSILFGS